MTFSPEDLPGQGSRLRPSVAVLVSLIFLFLSATVSLAGGILTYTAEPNIRVCLTENRNSLFLNIDGRYVVKYQAVNVAALTNGDVSFHFSPEGTPVAVTQDQTIKFYSPLEISPADSSSLIASSHDLDGITVDGQTYPGTMEIVPESNGSFRLINVVPLETYLRGVVPNELINNLRPDELQACMAQAIAARNYAFFRMSGADAFADGPKSKGFDVYSDTRDQVYSGMQGYKPLADSAVELTSGMIVEYRGQPARCFYSSTCGGHTASVQNVWQGQPALPYLQGVSDTDSATGEPFCIYNPHFYWTVTLSGNEVTGLVRRNLAIASPNYSGTNVTGAVDTLRILNRFSSGRVDSLEIKMNDGSTYFVRGDRTRYLFKSRTGGILESSLFRILTLRNFRGAINEVIIKGQGNGHGVGMCQWGALGMSRLGYSYRQILSHYYPGTAIKKVY